MTCILTQNDIAILVHFKFFRVKELVFAIRIIFAHGVTEILP